MSVLLVLELSMLECSKLKLESNYVNTMEINQAFYPSPTVISHPEPCA